MKCQLLLQASSELDASLRREEYVEMQQNFYNDGDIYFPSFKSEVMA
jgi:hypothetical protein